MDWGVFWLFMYNYVLVKYIFPTVAVGLIIITAVVVWTAFKIDE